MYSLFAQTTTNDASRSCALK